MTYKGWYAIKPNQPANQQLIAIGAFGTVTKGLL